MRFMASVSVSWASRLRAPWDMAPVENRRVMARAGSTSSRSTGGPAGTRSKMSCSSVGGRPFTRSANRLYLSIPLWPSPSPLPFPLPLPLPLPFPAGPPPLIADWSRWAAFISLSAFTTSSVWVWNSPFLRTR